MRVLVVPIMRGREIENDERRVGEEKYPAKKPGQDEHDCFSRGWLNTRGKRWSRAGPLVWRWLTWCRIDPRRLVSVLSRLFDTNEAISLLLPGSPADPSRGPPARQAQSTHPSRLRGLRPVAYPCRGIHANHGLGPRVVDWPVGAGLAGPRFPRGRQCTNVPPYLGHIQPPCHPSPNAAPCHPSGIQVSLYRLLPPVPARACNVCTEPRWTGSPIGRGGGTGDRPPPGPGRRDGRWGYLETSPPPNWSVRLTHSRLASNTTNNQDPLHTYRARQSQQGLEQHRTLEFHSSTGSIKLSTPPQRKSNPRGA